MLFMDEIFQGVLLYFSYSCKLAVNHIKLELIKYI